MGREGVLEEEMPRLNSQKKNKFPRRTRERKGPPTQNDLNKITVRKQHDVLVKGEACSPALVLEFGQERIQNQTLEQAKV